MRPAPETVLAWRPASLETAADAIASGLSRLVALEDDLAPTCVTVGWQGAAAAAAGRRVERLRRRLGDLVAEMATVVGTVNSEVPDLRTVRGELVGLLAVPELPAIAGMSPFDARTDAVLDRAAACDARIRAALQRARSDVISAGAWSLRDAALPTGLRGMSDAQLVDWTLTHPADAPSFLSALPAAVRRDVGEELGHRLGEGDPYDNLELLDGLGEDEVVATSVLETLGPAGLVALTSAVVPRMRDVAAHSLRRLVAMRRVLGSMLAAGNADNESPGARRVSDAWLRGLTDEVRQRDDFTAITTRWSLAPVLRYAAQSTALLTTVGAAVLHADRAHREASPTVASATEGMRAELNPALVTDPVAEVLDAASGNAEAARQLLGDREMLRHLLVERNWVEYEHGADISALGRALETATTDSPDDRSVAITEQMIDGLRDRFDANTGAPDLMDPRLRPHVGAVLVEYLPSVHRLFSDPTLESPCPLAGQRCDVAVPGSPAHATQSVYILLAEVGRDAEAGRLLAAEANAHTAGLIAHQLQGIDPELVPRAADLAMTNIVGPHGQVTGAIDHGYAMQLRDDQLAADELATRKRRDQFVNTTNAARLVLNTLPVVGEAAAATTDLARQQALTVQIDHTGATNREVGSLFSTADGDQELLVRSVVDAVLPEDLPLRDQEVLAAANEGGRRYVLGRVEAEKRLHDYE